MVPRIISIVGLCMPLVPEYSLTANNVKAVLNGMMMMMNADSKDAIAP